MTLATTSATDHDARDAVGSRARGERLVVTVPEAAALLGISRALAYNLAAQGELPVIRLGRRLVVPRRALFDLVGEDGSVTRAPATTAALGTPPAVVYRLVAEPAD